MTDSMNTQPASDETTAPVPTRSRRRPLLIGAAIAAALVLTGGGVAVGAAMADDRDDDDRSTADQSLAGAVSRDSAAERDHDDDSDDRHSDDDSARTSPSAPPADTNTRGAASADELDAIIAAASTAATGTITSIDAKRDGHWDIEFLDAAGLETNVRVAVDGTASVLSTDTDTDSSIPAGALDAATLDALFAAALTEQSGRIIEIDVDSDAASPYDVTVLRADGVTVELDLGSDFAILTTDLDLDD